MKQTLEVEELLVIVESLSKFVQYRPRQKELGSTKVDHRLEVSEGSENLV